MTEDIHIYRGWRFRDESQPIYKTGTAVGKAANQALSLNTPKTTGISMITEECIIGTGLKYLEHYFRRIFRDNKEKEIILW